MEVLPIGVFWCIVIWALFQRKHALVYVFFATMPFGSFAAIPGALTGGLTLTPTPIVAMLLIAKEFSSKGGLRRAAASALNPAELLLLFLFWLVAGITTAFMPRFFAGQVEVVPVRNVGLPGPGMLFPSIQNVSTFVYISISVLTVFAFSRMLRSDEMRRHALNALCLGAAFVIATGLADFASQYLSLQPALEMFRTATYTLMTEDEVLDSKRVVGLMPEASSFGGLVLSFLAALYFFRRAMQKGFLRDRIVPMMTGTLLLLVWLSTSSSAYLGLALFSAALVAEWFWRLLTARENPYLRRGLTKEFLVGSAGVGTILILCFVAPHLFAPMFKMVDLMVLQKSSTSSYEERNMWTQVSWSALLATNGLGVGLGGTRASNFAVALVSNSGFLGASLYFAFALYCLVVRRVRSNDAQGGAILSACRWSYLPAFVAILTVGTTPDFGLFNAFFYGFAMAVTWRPADNALRAAAHSTLSKCRSPSTMSKFELEKNYHAK